MLQGEQVVLRQGQPADLDALAEIFASPEVERWWHGYDRARIDRKVLRHDDSDSTVYVIEAAGEVANERAIAAYTKIGFRSVGTMRQHERAADGTWHDSVLVDLLADDLR